MKNRNWVVGIVLVVILIAGIYLLNRKPDDVDAGYRVGVFQVVRHPVLDGMAVKFQESLEAQFPGKIEFVTMVPEGDAAKTEQMAQKFATEEYDLVFVIGTNLAQSLARKTTTLPILLGASSDPESAELIDSWETPGKNVTGTSDLSPADSQLNRLKEILPAAKRIGIIYNPSEDNSKAIVQRFERECEKRGLKPISATISNQNEIKQTLISLVGKVDVVYAPTDATLQAGFPLLVKVANEVRIPIFNCDEGTAQQGAIFSVGFSYEDLGRISAEMAQEILEGTAKPETMPIRFAEKYELYYNAEQLAAYELKVPERWKEEGKQVSGQ